VSVADAQIIVVVPRPPPLTDQSLPSAGEHRYPILGLFPPPVSVGRCARGPLPSIRQSSTSVRKPVGNRDRSFAGQPSAI